MKKLLVTGASGFLGSRIVDFYKKKYEIYAPTHTEMDITKEESVNDIFSKYKPDIVIHCAAISDVGRCEREREKSWNINVNGSIHIAKASKKVNAKCILCSSDQVYFGSLEKGAHKEDEELQPFNLYGQGKLKAEEECQKVNKDCVLLRLSWMYDVKTVKEGEHSDFFKTLLLQLKGTDNMRFPIYDKRGITDVNEVVQKLEKTFDITGGVYNFGSPNEKNTFDTVYAVFEKLGFNTDRLEKNEEAFQTNPRNISMCQQKIKECGITFSSTEDGLLRNLGMIHHKKEEC